MANLKELYCFNPVTGKRDGKYCVWEGGGKCIKCEAADRIAELEERLSASQIRTEQLEGSLELALDAYKRLREALDRYGAHDFECPYQNLTPHLQPCNCGYSKALEEVK